MLITILSKLFSFVNLDCGWIEHVPIGILVWSSRNNDSTIKAIVIKHVIKSY